MIATEGAEINRTSLRCPVDVDSVPADVVDVENIISRSLDVGDDRFLLPFAAATLDLVAAAPLFIGFFFSVGGSDGLGQRKCVSSRGCSCTRYPSGSFRRLPPLNMGGTKDSYMDDGYGFPKIMLTTCACL